MAFYSILLYVHTMVYDPYDFYDFLSDIFDRQSVKTQIKIQNFQKNEIITKETKKCGNWANNRKVKKA